MKTLTARAADLSARRDLKPVWLVTLTTYTDRGAATVDTVYRFSDRQVLYDYGNTGTEREFVRLLRAPDPFDQWMHHLADPSASSLGRELTVKLANLPIDAGGARLYEVFEGKRLLFATVEVAQILLDASRAESTSTLRGLAGDEHQVWFRGEVVAHKAAEELVTLTVRTTLRAIPWIVCNDTAKNDPLDVGRRLPIVYGDRTRVPAIGWEVGWTTTLAEPILSISYLGDVKVTDAAGFPTSGTFSARVANEEVTAHWVDDKTINLDSRGVGASDAVIHSAGETTIELPDNIRFICNGIGSSSLGDAYIKNPATGELIRIPGELGLYTRTDADTTLISGKTVSSVNFTRANLQTVLDTFFPDVNFDGGVETITIRLAGQTVLATSPGNRTLGIIVDDLAALDVNSTTDESIRAWFGAAPPGETKTIVRFRIIMNYGMDSDLSNALTFSISWDYPGSVDTSETIDSIAADAPTELGLRTATSWRTPTGGPHTIGDYSGSATTGDNNVDYWLIVGTTPFGDGRVGDIYGEIEFEVLSEATASLAGALTGFGLRVFVDVNGPVASGGNYSVADDELIEHPSDVLRHVLADLCGYGHAAVDDTTFDALVTALGSGAKMAPVLNELGEDLEAIALRIAHEARANLVQEEGAGATLFKVYAANTSHEWGAAERTIDLWQSFELESRDGSEVATRFRALYAPDLSRGSEEDLWQKSLRADPEASDLSGLATSFFAAREADYGRRDHPGYAFATLYDDATAKDVMTYYAREEARDARIARVKGIPWWLAYDLERGTRVAATPPWGSAPLLWRVVSYRKDPGNELVDVVLVEVVA